MSEDEGAGETGSEANDSSAVDAEASSACNQYHAEAFAAKERGNAALKSADLPQAVEHYNDALRLFEESLEHETSQPDKLKQHDIVNYAEGRFATVDTAFPGFGDYLVEDLAMGDIVKHKDSHWDIPTRFKRQDLILVPKDLFDLRLAVLQNLTLVALKIARGTGRQLDYEDTSMKADAALAMDGKSPKALMRKGAALIGLGDANSAAKVLALAHHVTRGKDPEVLRLLELVKGKGKGKGKGKKKRGPSHDASMCQDPSCREPACEERQLESRPLDISDDEEDLRQASLGVAASQGSQSDEVADAPAPKEPSTTQRAPKVVPMPDTPSEPFLGRGRLRTLAIVATVALLAVGNAYLLLRYRESAPSPDTEKVARQVVEEEL